jgi:hypothetical protein
MTTKPQLTSLILLVAVTALGGRSMAQSFSAEDLARRTIERRAIEAVIWGMPVVNYDLMYQVMVRETKGSFNQIVYWSRLPDWKNQTLTPNPDSIYLMSFINTKDVEDADIAKAVTYSRRIKVYSLSQAANLPPTTFVDAIDVVYDATIPYDLRFFQSLDRFVQQEPWLTRDKAMIDQLKSIGIERGKPFNPDQQRC